MEISLLSCLLTDFGLCACAQSLGQLLADLQVLFRFAELQSLSVCIDSDKLHTVNFLINHSIYSIIACTANSNDKDVRCRFCVIYFNLQQGYFLLHS